MRLDKVLRSVAPALWLVAMLVHLVAAHADVLQGEISVFDTPQVARPDFPVPDDPGLLFFIQHSTGPNTVVYTARLNAQGQLDKQSPVDVFWRRFTSHGRRVELSYLERILAYGVNVQPSSAGKDAYVMSLAAYPKRTVVVEMDTNGTPMAVMDLPNHRVKLRYAYVKVADNRFIPGIDYIDIFGQDITSGKYVREHISLNGLTGQQLNQPDKK